MDNPHLKKLRAQQEAARPRVITRTVTVVPSAKPRHVEKPVTIQTKSLLAAAQVNGKRKTIEGHAPRPAKLANRSPRPSKESRNPVRHIRAQKKKSASPAVMTPQFTSSGEESADEDQEQARKRRRNNQNGIVDPNRRIRDLQAFSEQDQSAFPMTHSADVANATIVEHNRDKYTAFFTALKEEEEEGPIIQLQYPSASQREKYQLVRPTDKTDFKPLDEIKENMKVTAEHYLGYHDAKRVFDADDDSAGLVGQLLRAAKRGTPPGRVGAQQEFIEVVDEYNALLERLRKDGTLAKNLDEMKSIPLSLVEHIVKNQIYARTVSPQIQIVKEYEGFSDNVYGELLPRFLSDIFREVQLKSNQVFVDLGSGVGNCVLQAALEVGCESWGCEVMANPSKLARLQAEEFPGRCRLWGLKPGKVQLIQDNFLDNNEINKVLQRADVVLINNQAFNPELNEMLKYKFLDLKEGCKIVSLKPFVHADHQIKATNIDDPMNILEIEKRDRYSKHVSWTDDPGSWYIHTKDSSRLRKFIEAQNSH